MAITPIITGHEPRRLTVPLHITRRGVMIGAGGAVAALAASPGLFEGLRAKRPVLLTAGRRTLEVNGRAASVYRITQPDSTSGISTEIGTPFRVTLRNDAGVDTLIHWHGMAPPWHQDGVPGISAPAVAPGGTAHYDFPLDFAGTFWMHSHQGLQEQSLMTAPLIIHDRGASADRQEIVMMLHDFSFKAPEEIFANLRGSASSMAGAGGTMAMSVAQPADAGPAGMAMDLNDVEYDAFLANDRTLADPQVVRVEPRGRILLRVINGSAASNYVVDLGPVTARLVAVDGRGVQPITGSVFPVAMAQRIDLEFRLPPDQPSLPVFATLEGERTRTGIVLATTRGRVPRLGGQAPAQTQPLDFAMEQRLRAASPLPVRAADRVHAVDLTGDMASYTWGLNGREYGQDKPLMVAKGERVELVMANQTMMSHPMHLHGHPFQVVAFDGQRFSGALRDTVLVPPMHAVTIAFDADNPGHWAFHCHNLYHMHAGMMTTVRYENI